MTTPASTDRLMGPSTVPRAASSRSVDRAVRAAAGGSMAEPNTLTHRC
ncbi:hypothetical protein OG978_22505 [Streptomyces sp. NBC_01591]|nr:hypothetical protein [Streptomyces sp. NBC_01591]WSD69900.1 hypothetical protein OG978_22505 [Streptomyces sp. NBC_01591]